MMNTLQQIHILNPHTAIVGLRGTSIGPVADIQAHWRTI